MTVFLERRIVEVNEDNSCDSVSEAWVGNEETPTLHHISRNSSQGLISVSLLDDTSESREFRSACTSPMVTPLEQERICPMCEAAFPASVSMEDFENHVVCHLAAESAESLLQQFEIL